MTAEKREKRSPSVSPWRALRTLTAMQLKEKMDLSFTRSFQKALFKVLYFVIEFVIVTVICSLLLKYATILTIFDINMKIFPSAVIGMIFTFMLVLSIISATWSLVKSLYLSRDNLVLLTFPASSSIVFLSKIAVYFIYEIRKNFMFLVPMFVAYGINHEFAFYYYFWLLFLFLFISLLPVLIAALLSIPTLYVYQFFRKTKVLQYVLAGVLLLAVTIGVFVLIDKIPPDFNLKNDWPKVSANIQTAKTWFQQDMKPLFALTQMIIGKSLGLGLKGIKIFHDGTFPTLAALVLVLAGLLAACFLIAKPLFYKMASTPFEFTKKLVKRTPKNRKIPPFFSAVKKEVLISIKSGSFLSLFGILIIIQPLSIELLNRIYSVLDTRFLGTQMTIAFTLFIMLLINLSTSISVASIYSRDGASSYLNKVQPSSFVSVLFSKLVLNLTMGLIGIVITTARLSAFFAASGAMSPTSMFFFGAAVYFTYAAHLFWSAEMDIMKPQTKQYATFSEQANNPNENVSAILCFLLSAIVFGAEFFLALGNSYTVWPKMFGVTAAFLAFRVVNYILKIRAFYKES